METTFRLHPLESKFEVDLKLLQQSLPLGFAIEERIDGVYMVVEAASEEAQGAQYLVERELDRLFYLTRVRLRAAMVRRTVYADLKVSYDIQAALNPQIKPLNWTYELALQLRLWVLASEMQDPILRMLMLYQIIELASPTFEPYNDPTIPPNSLTECKLLRHLITHAGVVSNRELKNYCEHLGLPPLMLDRTDPAHVKAITSKLSLMESQARLCLVSAA